MMKQKTYEPWRKDAKKAQFLVWGVPLIAAVLAFYIQTAYVMLAMVVVVSMLYGFKIQASISGRQYGQHVERIATARGMSELLKLGVTVQTGVLTRHGDVDMIVTAENGKKVTVEIKSFHFWRSRIKDRARERKARNQARLQQKNIKAEKCIVWLPNGKKNLWARMLDFVAPERRPVVVVGSERVLAETIRSLLKI